MPGSILGDKVSFYRLEVVGLDVEYEAHVSKFSFSPPPLLVNTADDLVVGGCDADRCSLREAIVEAKATPEEDSVHFAIPGAGTHTIRVESPLPIVESPLVIDGNTRSEQIPVPPACVCLSSV